MLHFLIALAFFFQSVIFPWPNVIPSGGGGGGSKTWSMVQHSSNTACSSTSATCSVTVTSTGSGHLLVITAVYGSSSTDITISSTSGGGTSTHCTNCHATRDSSGDEEDISYILSSTSGATSISVTMSSSAFSGNWIATVEEYSWTGGGSAALDTSNSVQDNTSCTTCNLPSLTLTGTDDVVLYDLNSSQGTTAPGGIWTNPADVNTTGVFAAINTSSTLSTFAMSPSGVATVGAIAFK